MTAVSQLLGDEELQLRSAAAEMLRKESPVSAFRDLRASRASYDSRVWQRFGEMGWSAMLIPESLGGLAFGHRGVGLICEEIGRNLVATPFGSTAIHAVTLLASAPSALQASLLPEIAGAATTVALALDEGRAHDPRATGLTARRDGDGWLLQGVKSSVPDGSFAEHLLVLARTAGKPGDEEGLSLFYVPAELLDAADREQLRLVDQRDYARIGFHDLRIDSSALLGVEGKALELLDSFTDVAAAHSASELLGICDALFDTTLNYLKVREQFGVPIGSFQALQHRAAQLFTRIELLRSVVMDAHAALDEGRADVGLACSHARVMAIDVATLTGQEAIQIHGGMGVTDDLDVGLYYKRVLTLRQQYGSRGFHRERFARLSGY